MVNSIIEILLQRYSHVFHIILVEYYHFVLMISH